MMNRTHERIFKKNVPAVLLGFCLLLTGCASSPHSAAETGAAEGELRVAATSTAICELLDALEYEKVTGVPETQAALPKRYAEVQTIGAPMSPDLELIKKLDPDLLLSPKSLEESLAESYQNAGITSAFLDLSSVDGMYRAVSSLGEVLGREEQAAALTTDYEAYMETYASGVEKQPRVLLLMTFPDGFYLVATENSYVGNLVKLAGGENVYGAEYNGDASGFASINPEDIVQKEPDYIFVFAHYSEEEAFAFMEQEFAENQTWQYFDAVKENRIVYLPSEYFGMSADLSWTDALEYLKPYVHGDES